MFLIYSVLDYLFPAPLFILAMHLNLSLLARQKERGMQNVFCFCTTSSATPLFPVAEIFVLLVIIDGNLYPAEDRCYNDHRLSVFL